MCAITRALSKDTTGNLCCDIYVRLFREQVIVPKDICFVAIAFNPPWLLVSIICIFESVGHLHNHRVLCDCLISRVFYKADDGCRRSCCLPPGVVVKGLVVDHQRTNRRVVFTFVTLWRGSQTVQVH